MADWDPEAPDTIPGWARQCAYVDDVTGVRCENEVTKHGAKGLCPTDYRRALRNGTAKHKVRQWPWPENLLRRLRFMPPDRLDAGCVEFTGSTDSAGYGSMNRGGEIVSSHVAMWELVRGPIPADHHLHHHCRNKLCCNVGHLEPKTPAEHRGEHAASHCMQGHEFTPENEYWWNGIRRCRICRLASQAKVRERKRVTNG